MKGWDVRHLQETASTNTALVAAARAGAPDRTVIHADHQTAGRGRLGRTWEAPPGANLLCSVLFRDSSPDTLHTHVQAVALAAADAAERLTGIRPELKWPNDLLIDGRKVSGLLAEAVVEDGKVVGVVAGIGVNLNWAPEHGARLAADDDHPVDRDAFLAAFLDALAPLTLGDPYDRYRAELATIGKDVRVELPGDVVLIGTAVDVLTDGRLAVVDRHGVRHEIAAGDVVHLRPAP